MSVALISYVNTFEMFCTSVVHRTVGGKISLDECYLLEDFDPKGKYYHVN